MRSLAAAATAVMLALSGCAGSTPPPKPVSAHSPVEAVHHAPPEPVQAGNQQPFPSTYEPYPGVPTLVRNVTVFDGEGGRIEHGAVLFASGKVVEVGQDISAPAGATVIDGTGKWLTPGVIDVHSHMGVYAAPEVQATADAPMKWPTWSM